MAEYMTYERMMYLAKKMGLKVETPTKNYPWYADNASGYHPLFMDGTLGAVRKGTPLKVGQWGASYFGDYRWNYNNNGSTACIVYRSESGYPYGLQIDKVSLQRAIAQYPDVPSIPIFVGTNQVSAIYVKQNGTIKPAKPYIKQSGQIKAL